MSIALVNRFIPPDSAPTAAALARLAGLLTARAPSLDMAMLGTDRAYVGGGAVSETRLWRRLTAALADGRRLAQAAAAHKVVLTLTDPPFLAFHLARHLPPQRFWIEWAMDLYPHAVSAALGVRPRNFTWLPGRRPDLRMYLGPGQAAFLYRRADEMTRPVISCADGDAQRRAGFTGSPTNPLIGEPVLQAEKEFSPPLILPAGVREHCDLSNPPPSPENPKIQLVYAGNLGRAHWADALSWLATLCDPHRFRLTIAAYGAQAARLKTKLGGLPHVDWRDVPLADSELDAAHVHIVCLKENWTHVCVPSKATSALCRGRPILFFGAPASDVWGWANGGGWRLDPSPAACARHLPGILQEITSPPLLHAATQRAAAAGNRLREIESRTADALAEQLTRLQISLFHV